MPNRPFQGPGDRRRPSASAFRLSAALGLVSALAVSILVGSWAAAVPPAPAWHSGPIRADLDVEVARASPRLAATIVPAALPAATSAALPDAVAVETEPATLARNLKVGRGDTLMGLLVDAGIDRREAYDAITALRDVFRPRDLKPG
ncbi:MAG TPA: hypothetical protein VLL72_03440, partial [Kiloniellales bacterium]|nr:hypothetical protein [Kiloniellales bacterium]